MRAREGVMSSSKYGDELKQLYPVVEEGLPDSGRVDNVLEFLIMAGGRSLPEVSPACRLSENLVAVKGITKEQMKAILFG